MTFKRLTIVHVSFCTSQIWWTKISWISSRSGNTERCISCYHPICWWLTPLLLTSLTVSTLLGALADLFLSASRLLYQEVKGLLCGRRTEHRAHKLLCWNTKTTPDISPDIPALFWVCLCHITSPQTETLYIFRAGYLIGTKSLLDCWLVCNYD